jgi:hypothetical protein
MGHDPMELAEFKGEGAINENQRWKCFEFGKCVTRGSASGLACG